MNSMSRMNSMNSMSDAFIQHDGDLWRVLGCGICRGDQVMLHLASTTRGTQQRNGWMPTQLVDWVDAAAYEAAELAALAADQAARKRA